MEQKRYTVILDAYLWADNDLEAMEKSAKIAEFLKTLEDNHSEVVRVEETPFASLSSRLVHQGRLTLFEGKLIEV